VTRPKLLDVAEGLHYLHANHITHGSLSGVGIFLGSFWASPLTSGQPNILVDHDRRARLTNFELAPIVRGMDSTTQAAPEILGGSGAMAQAADVFAFGMVVIEVCPRPLLHLALKVEG